MQIAGPGRDVLLVSRPLDIEMCRMYALRARGGPREVFVATSEAEVFRILDRTS
jgi:hypothetical protein